LADSRRCRALLLVRRHWHPISGRRHSRLCRMCSRTSRSAPAWPESALPTGLIQRRQVW